MAFTISPNRPACLELRPDESTTPEIAWEWLSIWEQRGTHRWLDSLERLGWRFGLAGGEVVAWPPAQVHRNLPYALEASLREVCLAVHERVIARITAGNCVECGETGAATYCRECWTRRETRTREMPTPFQPVPQALEVR